MFAIEFRAKIKNGTIELPKKFRKVLTENVKVIILKEETLTVRQVPPEHTIIDQLLAEPIKMKEFSPFSREEAHAR